MNRHPTQYITIHQVYSIDPRLGRNVHVHGGYILLTCSQFTSIYITSNP